MANNRVPGAFPNQGLGHTHGRCRFIEPGAKTVSRRAVAFIARSPAQFSGRCWAWRALAIYACGDNGCCRFPCPHGDTGKLYKPWAKEKAMSRVRVLVGARKGAFILESDGKRDAR